MQTLPLKQSASPPGGNKEICPICHQATPKQLVEQFNRFENLHYAACDVVFSEPMEETGPNWYQSHAEYEFRNKVRLGQLRWYHHQFFRARPAQGERLLDIGCGTGSFLPAANEVGYRVTGLDSDQHAIETARRRFGLTDTHAVDLKSCTQARSH